MNVIIQRLKPHRLLMLFLITVVLIQSYLFIENTHPYIGIELEQTDEGYQISRLKQFGWGKANDLMIGDQIIAIDGKPTMDYLTVKTHHAIERADSITINRDHHLYHFKIEYEAELFTQYLLYLILPTIYFIFTSLVVLVILRRSSTAKSARLLIILTMLVSVNYSSLISALKLNMLAAAIVHILLMFTPAIFYHFIYQFFYEKDKQWITKKSVQLLYSLAGLASLLALDIYQDYNTHIHVLIIYTIIMFVVLSQLFKGMRKLKYDPIIDTVQSLMLAIIFAIAPYLCLFVLPSLSMGKPIISVEITMVFLFFIPGGFLYMIVSDQLYVLGQKIKRLPYYLLLGSSFALLTTLIYVMLDDEIRSLTESIHFFLFMLLSSLFFIFFKNQLDHYLRSYLYVAKHDYQTSLYRFSENVKLKQSRAHIIEAVKDEIKDVLKLTFLEAVEQKSQFLLPSKDYQIDQVFSPLLHEYQGQRLVIGKLIGKRSQYALPLAWQERKFTILFIAIKGHPLSKEQLDWLSSLAQFANLAIERQTKIEDLLSELEQAKASEDMEWLSRLLFHWSENERRSLARDIHDTFLQDLIVLRRRVEAVKTENNESIKQDLLTIVEQEIKDIIFEIRETCSFLYPTILKEVGLIEAIHELVSKFRLQSNSVLNFHTNINGNLTASMELKLTIYRIVQEWLSNARKHAQANHVSIVIVDQNDRVKLEYNDDGIGMDTNAWPRTYSNMGILSIKERVRSLMGQINFSTSQNQGLRMTISIPYKKGEN